MAREAPETPEQGERARIDSGTAGKTLGRLLDRVLGGETIEITRRGRVIARLVPHPVAVAVHLGKASPESAAEKAAGRGGNEATRAQAARDEILGKIGGKRR